MAARTFRITGVVLAGAVAAAMLAGCGQQKAGASRAGHAKPKIVPSAEAGAAEAPASDGPDPGGGQQDGGTGGTATPRPTWSKSPPSTPSGPQIVYFKLTQQPKCGGVSAGKRVDPVPAVIAWKVTGGATSVALSVDNPELVGGYRTYPGTEGSESFLFSCGGPAGTSETHVYTINTVGGGPAKRAQFSATTKSLPQS